MENRQYATITKPETTPGVAFDLDSQVQTRLGALIAENTRLARENFLYPTRTEFLEAQLMKKPLDSLQAFGRFGLILGVFPPAAIFYKLFHRGSDEIFLLVLLLLMNALCAVGGYFSGRLLSKTAFESEFKSWNRMLLQLPFIGILWGVFAGAVGGVLFFVIGALFGAVAAAAVGAVALPVFTVFHRLLKRGEFIEQNIFLPLSVGIALVIAAFILGL